MKINNSIQHISQNIEDNKKKNNNIKKSITKTKHWNFMIYIYRHQFVVHC